MLGHRTSVPGHRRISLPRRDDRRAHLLRLVLVVYALLTAYISLSPLVGLEHGPWSTPLLTLLGSAFAVLHATRHLGRRRTAWLLGLTVVISLAFETVGVWTGWIYGPYHYTDHLGPRFLGLVPYLIPLAWFMMVYPSRVIAERWVGNRWKEGWRRSLAVAGLASVVMTSWDLLMDPMMVHMGAWEWESPGVYFGIPAHNYLGWLLTTFTVYAAFEVLGGRKPEPGPSSVHASDAVWSYFITWAGNSAAALQFDLGGPALVGAFTAGLWAILALVLPPV